MQRAALIVILLVSLAGSLTAQSGRAKPSPTPTPRRIDGPSVIYTPDAPIPSKVGLPTPTPTPRPASDDVIRVDSALVPIPVSVTDERGRPVTDLLLKDFQLAIEGRVADIGDLSRSESPVRIAMLFDNSSSVRIAREFEKAAAVRFFRRVIRPQIDTAALFSVADYTRREQGFTKDVSLLTAAIEGFPPPQGATALLDGIADVAEYLRSVDGRRVLVIVSDGEDTYSDLALEAVIPRVLAANVQVYVVKTTDFENFKRTGARVASANVRSLTAERRMIEITRQTGGAVYSPITEREMDDAFDQISADLSQQYILGYYPDENAVPGAFRNIAVTLRSHPNYKLRTRSGYYVPKR